MKWQGRRQSTNVEDRRGQGGTSQGFGGFNPSLLAPLFKLLFSKVGLFIVGAFLVISLIMGKNPLSLISNLLSGGGLQTESTEAYQPTAEDEEMFQFCKTILGDTEVVWNKLLKNYREPTLVLFTGSVSSACGAASSATGPFYCPGDEKVYLDYSFFDEMARRMNAPGDFAQAYVIAHEVGHHIQKITGISDKMNRLRGQVSQTEYNKYSVMLELQADFLAGVWAHHSQQMTGMMETGDLEEAMNAANAIGDDRLQKQSSGRVVPDSFTHGTSAQRMRWFRKGFETGDLSKGDTFSATSL
jgi:uncharacterized protein